MKLKLFPIFFLLAGCLSAPVTMDDTSLNFIIIGNTCPESPFKEHSPEIFKLINALNKENPTFIINSGNIVYGGYTSATREIDILNQYEEHARIFSRLARVCRYVPGELDSFIGSMSHYEKFIGKNAYHSFTYGPVVFIVLNSTSLKPREISPEQIKWLNEELNSYDKTQPFIILSHHPFFAQKQSDGLATVKDAAVFHSIFMKHNIRFVISGARESYFRVEKDGISYINAGSVPVYKPCGYGQFRYYSVSLSHGTIQVQGRTY